MNICVFGLWHLGTVTAACLSSAGFKVTGLDFEKSALDSLRQGVPPLYEPGLEELVKKELARGNLHFTSDPQSALANADILWVSFDTPVDENDVADTLFVMEQVKSLFPHIPDNAVVLISSQLPVGSTALLEQSFGTKYPGKIVSFAYSPENLRLGKAIAVFQKQERIVAGVRDAQARKLLENVFHPFTGKVEWMSVESAEMTKHALNAFLATSVTFINEIATICEVTGADAVEVERGLKSESRIGPKAYLKPGGAFSGGTLARDVQFLQELAGEKGVSSHLLTSVQTSNSQHKLWATTKFKQIGMNLRGKSIAVLGLTYKPETDTLRRSAAVDLCRWLSNEGAKIFAFDPAVKAIPNDLQTFIRLSASPEEALRGAHAAIIATEWEEFKNLDSNVFAKMMSSPIVLDQNRFLEARLGNDVRIQYLVVGKPA